MPHTWCSEKRPQSWCVRMKTTYSMDVFCLHLGPKETWWSRQCWPENMTAVQASSTRCLSTSCPSSLHQGSPQLVAREVVSPPGRSWRLSARVRQGSGGQLPNPGSKRRSNPKRQDRGTQQRLCQPEGAWGRGNKFPNLIFLALPHYFPFTSTSNYKK